MIFFVGAATATSKPLNKKIQTVSPYNYSFMYYNKLRDDHKYCSEWAFFRAWNVHSFTLSRFVTFHCSFILNWRIHGWLGRSTNRIHIHSNILDSLIPRNKHINTNANRKTNEKNPFLLFFSIFLRYFFSFLSFRHHCHAFHNQYDSLCYAKTPLDSCGVLCFRLVRTWRPFRSYPPRPVVFQTTNTRNRKKTVILEIAWKCGAMVWGEFMLMRIYVYVRLMYYIGTC